jgi:hypothetical protein
MTGGMIHKPMCERLILCEYALTDLTTTNANVFYELGLRHAAQPSSPYHFSSRTQASLPLMLRRYVAYLMVSVQMASLSISQELLKS